MDGIRLTRVEEQRIVESAIRQKTQKQEANRRAHEERIAKGRKRLEKTVPVDYLPELRRIVAESLDAYGAGRELRLRKIPDNRPGASPGPTKQVDEQKVMATARNTSGHGSRGRARSRRGSCSRKSAQTARRRERDQLAGKMRTTFEVPDALALRISLLVDQVVKWMDAGMRVEVEDAAVRPESDPPTRQPMRGGPTGAVRATLDALFEQPKERDEPEASTLFEDIQAAARIGFNRSG